MNIFGWLFEKKKGNKDEEHEKKCNHKNIVPSGFYVPDTRTPEEHDALKREYLHPDAAVSSSGICSVGQADTEKMILEMNSDIFKGVQYVATLDTMCCSKCWPLDGLTFPSDITKRPPVPRHDGCRCVYVLKTKSWRDFGIDMDDLESVARPYVLAEYQHSYKKDPTKKLKKPRRIIRKVGRFNGCAEEWIRSLPKKEQRQFFATDFAYSLWADGKIKGIDLLNKETWDLRSDDELRVFLNK